MATIPSITFTRPMTLFEASMTILCAAISGRHISERVTDEDIQRAIDTAERLYEACRPEVGESAETGVEVPVEDSTQAADDQAPAVVPAVVPPPVADPTPVEPPPVNEAAAETLPQAA